MKNLKDIILDVFEENEHTILTAQQVQNFLNVKKIFKELSLIEMLLEILVREGTLMDENKTVQTLPSSFAYYKLSDLYRETGSKKLLPVNKKWGVFENLKKFKDHVNEAKHLKPFGQVGGYYHGNAAAGILPICPTTKRMLLGYRGLECNEPHTWGIFGGKADDDGETMEGVAVREFYEETRYSGELELIPAYVYNDAKHDFSYHSFIGLVPIEFVPRLNWENEKAQWFTYEEAIKLSYDLHFGIAKWLKDLRDYYPNI